MTTTLLQIQTHPATDRAASTDTMRDRARRALRAATASSWARQPS